MCFSPSHQPRRDARLLPEPETLVLQQVPVSKPTSSGATAIRTNCQEILLALRQINHVELGHSLVIGVVVRPVQLPVVLVRRVGLPGFRLYLTLADNLLVRPDLAKVRVIL